MSALPEGLTQAEYDTARDMARLAAQSYDWNDYLVAEAGMALFSGIDEIRNQTFEVDGYSKLASDGSFIDWIGTEGLDYTVYQQDDSGDLVVAFRGTEPLSAVDWVEDIEQAFGQSEQYEQAAALARSMQSALDQWNSDHNLSGDEAIELSFTGHSLGGGLATAAALASDNEAIVFDAAGLSDGTILANQLDLNNADQITNFNVQGDFLTDHNGLMDSTTLGSSFGGLVSPQQQYGETFWLESVSEQADFGGWLVPDNTWAVEQAEAVLNPRLACLHLAAGSA